MKCPICRQETSWQNNPTRPFCSARCQAVDLTKWADGDYRIAGATVSEIETPTTVPTSEKEDYVSTNEHDR